MGLISGYRAAANRMLDHAENHPRVPLTAGQHILHLLLTVLTAGLWSPVWLIRAWRGNPAPRTGPTPPPQPSPSAAAQL